MKIETMRDLLERYAAKGVRPQAAALTRNGLVVGVGWEGVREHAVAAAVEKAGKRADGAELHVMAEPCVDCERIAREAGVASVAVEV